MDLDLVSVETIMLDLACNGSLISNKTMLKDLVILDNLLTLHHKHKVSSQWDSNHKDFKEKMMIWNQKKEKE